MNGSQPVPGDSLLVFGLNLTWISKSPISLYTSIFLNTYCKGRALDQLFAYDASNTATGRAITRNWIRPRPWPNQTRMD